MKHLILSIIFSAGLLASYGQNEVKTKKETTPVATNQGLMYAPQLPEKTSYKVVGNSSQTVLSKKTLMEINKHRKADKDFVWKSEEGAEILIYKRNQ